MADLTISRSTNRKLQNAVNKYGFDSFQFEILCCVLDLSKIIEIEQSFLDEYQSYNIGYNIRKIADSNIGIVRTKEYCEKQSKARKGKSFGSCKDHVKLRISEANSGKNNGMFGQSHSSESRVKIGEASVRYWRSRIKPKPFICVETGQHFDYIADASHALKLKGYAIKCCLTGIRHTCGGYHFQYV